MNPSPAASRLVIDTRPLWRVALNRTQHWILMGGALSVFLWLYLHEPFAGLEVKGQRMIAIFALCALCWVTQAIPLSVTGIMVIFLLPLCGILSASDTYSLFGNRAVFFILGAFIIAAAVMQTGLSARVAMLVLDRVGTTPRRLMLGLMFLAAGLSHLMPEHAVAAMLLPIAIEIARVMKLRPGSSNMGAGMFLGLTWGAIIGGIATLLGGARNPLAVEILHTTTGRSIGFLEFWLASFPLVILCLGAASFVILTVFPPEVTSTESAREALRARLRLMGRMSLEERVTALILAATVSGWILAEHIGLDVGTVALMGATALFAFRVISWNDVERTVNWGVILMYGGAIALGQAMNTENSGAADWIARAIMTDWLLAHPAVALIALAALALVLTEGLSNAAVVAMMLPIGLHLAEQMNVDPRIMVFVIALPAGLGFILPIASPPNALAYSTGFVHMKHNIRGGVVLDVICLGLFVLVKLLWWGPVLGYH